LTDWNENHVRANVARHPDDPELEDALNKFRQLYEFYSVQVDRRYKVVNTIPVQEAWDYYLKLRNHSNVKHR